jgi:hypothetical protein
MFSNLEIPYLSALKIGYVYLENSTNYEAPHFVFSPASSYSRKGEDYMEINDRM